MQCLSYIKMNMQFLRSRKHVIWINRSCFSPTYRQLKKKKSSKNMVTNDFFYSKKCNNLFIGRCIYFQFADILDSSSLCGCRCTQQDTAKSFFLTKVPLLANLDYHFPGMGIPHSYQPTKL